ncbi:MAG: hypothetical protein IJ079_03905 [Lachnospiraceae bacterium]|nr:hypothetical protein [Lachnospiraceae bacterium]MBR1567553.1 hypothetical protein [Lachnospiraceae bacterium]MBR1568709.1 hypothetical protein [Lachnospiraceae bacterium]
MSKYATTGVTTETPGKIQYGAGVYFTGITYSETAAPTPEEINAHLIGATQEGGTLTIAPEFYTPDLDGVQVNLIDVTQKVGEKATMETTMAELTPANIAHAVIGNVGETTDENYDIVTSSADLQPGHYYDGFGYCGKFMSGRPFIVVFKKALCTSGFSLNPKNKSASGFKGTFECYSDVESAVDKLPYCIFVMKESKWTQISAEEAIVESQESENQDPKTP